MKDANSLRKVVKFDSKTKTREEILEKKSADILLDVCEATLEKCEIDEETKEICIYFEKISQDFSSFKSIKVETEKKSIKEVAEESIDMSNYATYLPLKFVTEKCTKVPFSGQKNADYKKILALSDILEERGLYCCARCGWNEIYFAVVLKL